MMTGKQRAYLRGLANTMDPIFQIGKNGIEEAFLNQLEDAFEFYKKASAHTPNDFTTPRYAYKAGLMALEIGKKDEALKLFTNIKDNYKGSVEATNIDVYLGMAQ